MKPSLSWLFRVSLWAALLLALCRAAGAAPVLLDFYLETCAPCQQMKPVVAELEKQGYQVRRINGHQEPDLAATYSVTSYPTFIALDGSQQLGRRSGACSLDELKNLLGAPTNDKSLGLFSVVARVRVSDSGGGTSLGSGVLIDVHDGAGYVLTNNHVVKGAANAQAVEVSFPDGFVSRGEIVRRDTVWDIAAVRIAKPKVAWVPLASADPVKGQWLTLTGYGDLKSQGRHATGQVIGFTCPKGESAPDWVDFGCVARKGDSGGPVFNESGEVIALVWGCSPGQGSSTAVCCLRLRRFLRGLTPRFVPLQQSPDFRGPPLPKPEPYVPSEPATPAVPAPPQVDIKTPDANSSLLSELQDKLAKAKAELDDLRNANPLKAELEKLRGEHGGLLAKVKQLETDLLAKDGIAADLRSKLDKLTGESDGLISRIKALERDNGGLQGKLAAGEEALQDALSKLGIKDTLLERSAGEVNRLTDEMGMKIISAVLAAAGISIPGGSLATWLIMRGGKKVLQDQIDSLKQQIGGGPASLRTPPAAAPQVTSAAIAPPQTIHHNSYVPFENNIGEWAWAEAHRMLGEKYPGMVNHLRMIQQARDQILAGIEPGKKPNNG